LDNPKVNLEIYEYILINYLIIPKLEDPEEPRTGGDGPHTVIAGESGRRQSEVDELRPNGESPERGQGNHPGNV
jgi:hypothetical protein